MTLRTMQIGAVFGRLTVVAWHGYKAVECRCECGRHTTVVANSLRQGLTRSCGCLHREELALASRVRNRKHGHHVDGRPSREYTTWVGMIQRCHNPKGSHFESYGGRGIKVCDRWRSDFRSFLEDMGPRPEGASIDRYPDIHGDYEPGNVRWATKSEQNTNKRHHLRLFDVNDQPISLASMAQHLAMTEYSLRKRLRTHVGWPIVSNENIKCPTSI